MLNRGYGFGERKNFRIYVFLFSIFLLILMIPTVYAFIWSETIYVQPKARGSLTFDMIFGRIVTVRIWSIDGISDDSVNISLDGLSKQEVEKMFDGKERIELADVEKYLGYRTSSRNTKSAKRTTKKKTVKRKA